MVAMKKMVWTMAVVCWGMMGCVSQPTEWLIDVLYEMPEKIPAGGEVKWSCELQNAGNIISLRSFCVGNDRTIYVGTNYRLNQINSKNSEAPVFKLQAVNSDGALRWEFDLDESMAVLPIAGPDGAVYIYRSDSSATAPSFRMYALNTDGTPRWQMEKAESLIGSPMIDAAGTIYLATKAGTLYAVNPDGTEKWTLPLSGNLDDVPCVVGRDGLIYLVSPDAEDTAVKIVQVLDPANGKMLRTFSIADGTSLVAVGTDGTVYAKYGNEVRALNADGTQRWSFKGRDFEFIKHMKLGTNGKMYVIFSHFEQSFLSFYPSVETSYSRLCALKSDGSRQWSIPLGTDTGISYSTGSVPTNLMINEDGACYFCTVSGQLHAISAGGRWKWKLDENISVSSADLGPEGTIYLISGDTLYAVED